MEQAIQIIVAVVVAVAGKQKAGNNSEQKAGYNILV